MNVQKTKFSSKEFLRRRRPEKFSDSTIRETGTLDRVVLEHFLSTLNTRNQELQFEDFAKKICEKIICPNLLEQTGPVAGGMVKLTHKHTLFRNRISSFGSKVLMKHQIKNVGPLR
ncbi:hypothetical protein [Morganella morganii]|uniref:hypothetical protein n=1 Tax=Morganella morganii TaxID=582 RepID=UPI002023B066|nr:hypothetical protein [Morganella morganii]